MPILRAYLLPHPPLAVPDVGRGDEKKIKKTLAALDEAASDIAALAPETIIFVTPHNVLYADYFHISPGAGATGDLTRFNERATRFKAEYDAGFAAEIISLAERESLPAGSLGERDAQLDHGVTVPMWYIDRRYSGYKSLRISQSGLDSSNHYRLGQMIAQAAENTGRKAVLVASGDLSHRLLRGSSHGYAPEGEKFDAALTQALSTGDFLSLFKIPDDLRERAAECGYNSVMVLAGCFDRRRVSAKLLSYEGPFGVGYAVISVAPGEPDDRRDILEQYAKITLAEARGRRDTEDPYRALARAYDSGR